MYSISNPSSLNSLRICFKTFKNLVAGQVPTSWYENFNIEEAHKFFSKFAHIYAQTTDYSANLNIFELCSLGHDEVKNCRFLSWLLDENAAHGLGHRFLEELISFGSEPNEKLCFKEALAARYATRTEICPNADKTDRVDIVCESLRMLVYIEVKIDSNEHTSQTERYYSRLIHNSAGRQNMLIFLSIDDAPYNLYAKNIRWQDIGVIAAKMASEANSQFVQALLMQYSNFVRSFYSYSL